MNLRVISTKKYSTLPIALKLKPHHKMQFRVIPKAPFLKGSYSRNMRSWCNGYRLMEINTAIRVQMLNEAVCISHGANTFGKCMNPTILPTPMGKIVRQTGLFSLS